MYLHYFKPVNTVDIATMFFADWDTCEIEDVLLDRVSRFVLAVLLKHTGLSSKVCAQPRYTVDVLD